MYEVQNYTHLLGTPGFSDQMLKNHFTLYQGYVTNFNKLNDLLIDLEKEGKVGTPVDTELNRRFGWEFNGMRLHELYFDNMKNSGVQIRECELLKKISEEWGNKETWEKDFRTMGAARGIGWVILYFDAGANKLFNVWINEHDVGHLAGCVPLLVMDVFEHAYMLDYGLKRADYIEAFFNAIDWDVVSKRFETATK
ncbi:MAG: Fe-Mn family superoxide dismutase [Patescibacteria group bacterium]